ncbi:hypothetical protein [Novosphingobium sp. TCA1]|jgi:hypothetical protein|uniref:hypothetical protein n=1 Tax=Novosphingobium sp. TCA1 TaxID=2682474 RepID=UPI00130A1072|nr:hypothetical protein [Novosphingobium sp. TCA1]GFE72377.1 hypothetical protein NTCA1_00260 [Novosphingobium sp. TCA1]
MQITVTEADAYHALRGNEDWQYFGSDTEKLSALYRASDFIRASYRTVDTETAASLIREATIQLAPMIDNLTTLRQASAIKTKKESLDGVVSEETTYFDNVATSDPFPDITALLSPVTVTGSNGKGLNVIKVVR